MGNLHKRWVQAVPFLFVVLWSTGFIGAKYASPYIEPFHVLLIRMLMTLVAFGALALILKAKWPSPVQAMHQMVTGFLVHAVYLGGVFAAIEWGLPAGVTAIIMGLQPLLTALMSWQLMGDNLRPVQWLGLLIGFVGVALVLLSGEGGGQFTIDTASMIAAVAALVAISVGTLYQKRFGSGTDLFTGSFYQYLMTAIAMAVVAFTFETGEINWQPELIGALLWMVFGLSVSAILLLMLMIREGEAAKVASYFYLVPPLTAIEAWLLFDEQLNLMGIGAIALTVLGIYLVLRRH
ncbi:DMT family transporter [Pontibacterium sp.]|uniref:DMT family transporter n=1 Tax=Pontibacterium sp. TaxID=2036026 RepID=UPI0035637A0A